MSAPQHISQVHKALVLLTRPAGRNEALVQALHAQGITALCAPLLTVSPHPHARQSWPDPANFDLIIFVSGYAAQCWLQCTPTPGWPAHTLAATVGVASAQPLSTSGWLAPSQLIHPPQTATQDSESLWQLLQPHVMQLPAPRVLIVGAAHGRDWLQNRLKQAGCRVERCVVYERSATQWQAADLAPLRDALQDSNCPRPIVLLTSSQAVQALANNLCRLQLTNLYARVRFLLIHPRIADALHARIQDGGQPGIPLDVTLCAPDDEAILNAITQMQTATITP